MFKQDGQYKKLWLNQVQVQQHQCVFCALITHSPGYGDKKVQILLSISINRFAPSDLTPVEL